LGLHPPHTPALLRLPGWTGKLEGAESTTKGFPAITTGSNWTQIFHKEIKVTRTMNNISQYGVTEELAYQSDKSIPELMRLVERTVLHSKDGNIAASVRLERCRFAGLHHHTTLPARPDTGNHRQRDYEHLQGRWRRQLIALSRLKLRSKSRTSTLLRHDSSASIHVPRTENTLGMVINNIVTPFGTCIDRRRWCAKPTIALHLQ